MRKNIVIFGSTGSIGMNALDVVRRRCDLNVVGLSAHRNVELLLKQIREFRPQAVSVTDPISSQRLEKALSAWKNPPEVFNHGRGAQSLARLKNSDFVLCGMVGASGLLPLVAALKAGKTVGLANKEALVIAGELISGLSRRHKAPIIPVDSEHSAIYQCLKGHEGSKVSKIILTASGGPFYRFTQNLDSITVKQALNHPTWKMGSKITVDSATLMNKGLEAIEAHYLFGVPMEKIQIVIHPESIVHSMVEFEDGAVLAQMSHPDMRLPIQYALTYPERGQTPIRKLDFAQVKSLHFAAPEFSRFPCLGLALAAGKKGGTAPAALSAANEVAVQAFLRKEISFMSIPRIVKKVLSDHHLRSDEVPSDEVRSHPTLNDVLEVDQWARKQARRTLDQIKKENV